MSPIAIFWPIIAHALLVFIVYGLLGVRRWKAVAGGEAKLRQFKLRGDEPASTAPFSNNLLNQFEAPVLFYAACLSLFVTGGVTTLTVLLAWLFVISRYAHAYVHLTSNNVGIRFNCFGFGLMVLFVMWAALALHIVAF
ncbi:MAG: MAPEG family protein [Mesorhizobium sp.]